MAKNQIRVKVLEVRNEEQISESFKKREMIGIIEGEYPEEFKFECIQNKVSLLDDVLEGTYVTIHYNLKGKRVEKDNKVLHFVTLNAWKIDVTSEE